MPHYYTHRHPRADISFRTPIPFGTPELADEVVRILDAEGTWARFQIAEAVRKALAAELFDETSAIVNWPVFNFASNDIGNPDDAILSLTFLPNFLQPARELTMFRRRAGKRLELAEVFLFSERELAAIDPTRFTDEYRLRPDDQLGFRNAVIQILKSRNGMTALYEYEAFDEEDEIVAAD